MLTPDKLFARFVHGVIQEYRRLEAMIEEADDGEAGQSISDSASVDLAEAPDAPDLPVGFSRPPHVE
jgi:hypothetical protein